MGEKKKKKGKKSDKNTIVTFADQYDDDELLRPFKSGVPPLDELPKKSNLKDKNPGTVDHNVSDSLHGWNKTGGIIGIQDQTFMTNLL